MMWLFTFGVWAAIGIVFATMIYMGGTGTSWSLTLGLTLSAAVIFVLIGLLLTAGIDPLHIEMMTVSACGEMGTTP